MKFFASPSNEADYLQAKINLGVKIIAVASLTGAMLAVAALYMIVSAVSQAH